MSASLLMSKRVLVVEDDAIIAMALVDMLTMLGSDDIVRAETVNDALDAIEAGHFDLAILDIKLGNENGLLVADRCSVEGLPVIYATGFGDVLVRVMSTNEQMLAKPYTKGDLEQAILRLSKLSSRHSLTIKKEAPFQLGDQHPL